MRCGECKFLVQEKIIKFIDNQWATPEKMKRVSKVVESEISYCYRHPPLIVQDANQYSSHSNYTLHPEVTEDDWCWEFLQGTPLIKYPDGKEEFLERIKEYKDEWLKSEEAWSKE